MEKASKQDYERHLTNINWVSVAVLKEPEQGRRGALILAMVDEIVPLFQDLRNLFYIIEWRGWKGMNYSKYADIKLVEDGSTLEETKRLFPRAISLDLAMGDFADTEQFKPLETPKPYSAIQIASWSGFKRHELFVEATTLLPKHRFLKFGHFPNCSDEEQKLKKRIIEKSRSLKAPIDYPYKHLRNNRGLPSSPREINQHINSARIGILTSANEGMNRFKMECLSANIPFLVPADSVYPIKKHINDLTGVIYEPTPKGLAGAIQSTLNQISSFFPRGYILANTGKANSIRKLEETLNYLAERDGQAHYFVNLEFDGRNQSLSWGKKAISLLERYCKMEGPNGK